MGVKSEGITTTQLTFTIKEGKLKMEFDQTTFKYNTGTVWAWDKKPSMSGKIYDKWKESVLLEMDALIADYKKQLNKVDDF